MEAKITPIEQYRQENHNTNIHAPSVDNTAIYENTCSIMAHWEAMTGLGYTPYTVNMCVEWQKRGCEPGLIMGAIESTARAKRPSWAYLEAIINAQIKKGVYTAAEFEQNNRRWAEKRLMDAQKYTQREYTAANSIVMSPDLLRELKDSMSQEAGSR